MIIEVSHDSLIQRECEFAISGKDVAIEVPAVLLQFLTGVEEVRVVRHVEHAHKGDSPGVTVGVVLPDQDGDSVVDAQSYLGIAAGAEDRAGARVWVEQGDLVGREGEAPVLVLEFRGVMQEEREVHPRLPGRAARKRKQRELHAGVNGGEQAFPVLEIVQSDFFDYVYKLEPSSLDGIFFDPFFGGTSIWEDSAIWNEVMPRVVTALRPGGVFMPCFSTFPVLRQNCVPFFDRIIVERRSYRTYAGTNYTPALSGDAFIQCFVRTR